MKLQNLQKLEYLPADPALREFILECHNGYEYNDDRFPFSQDSVDGSLVFDRVDEDQSGADVQNFPNNHALHEFILHVHEWAIFDGDLEQAKELNEFFEHVDFRYNPELHEQLLRIFGWKTYDWEAAEIISNLLNNINEFFDDVGFKFNFPLDPFPFPFNQKSDINWDKQELNDIEDFKPYEIYQILKANFNMPTSITGGKFYYYLATEQCLFVISGGEKVSLKYIFNNAQFLEVSNGKPKINGNKIYKDSMKITCFGPDSVIEEEIKSFKSALQNSKKQVKTKKLDELDNSEETGIIIENPYAPYRLNATNDEGAKLTGAHFIPEMYNLDKFFFHFAAFEGFINLLYQLFLHEESHLHKKLEEDIRKKQDTCLRKKLEDDLGLEEDIRKKLDTYLREKLEDDLGNIKDIPQHIRERTPLTTKVLDIAKYCYCFKKTEVFEKKDRKVGKIEQKTKTRESPREESGIYYKFGKIVALRNDMMHANVASNRSSMKIREFRIDKFYFYENRFIKNSLEKIILPKKIYYLPTALSDLSQEDIAFIDRTLKQMREHLLKAMNSQYRWPLDNVSEKLFFKVNLVDNKYVIEPSADFEGA